MNDLLQANLIALQSVDPDLADRLRQVDPDPAVTFDQAQQESALTATIIQPQTDRPIALASKYRPLTEADRLAQTADTQQHATMVVLGVGVAHHVAALVQRCRGTALVVAYEPNEQLLRAVFEHIDCTAWLSQPNLVLFAGEVDGGRLTQRMETHIALITQGVQIITHPPSRQCHGPALNHFAERFTQFVAYCRTNIATTLVNAATTCRNLAHNLGRYAAGATLDELTGIAAGRPAVLVAAGPSLAKNVHLLTDPSVRPNVVVIAVQTVLKPLLARGVRPDFVTALDYHEISRRFYEGLDELNDVTLIAEPKANKAILDHYPGPIRLLQNNFLDLLMGDQASPRDGLRAGTTVAHLSFYLAQYLGCDPIIFIGQDLGFSDGLYYCPGTAIHEVWANQLSPFNTLEMMEWKRVVRQRNHLKKMDDVHGRPIYTDEQMLTYLRQFERDFSDAKQMLIDATEGGLPKQHTQQVTLSDALAQNATEPVGRIPLPLRSLDQQKLESVSEHLAQRRVNVQQLRSAAQNTLPLLEQMITHQRDKQAMDKLFKRLRQYQKQVTEQDKAFSLVNQLNQIGALNRIKADRAIRVADPADPFEKQKRELERDIENLNWLVAACDETLEIFEEASVRLTEQHAEVAL